MSAQALKRLINTHTFYEFNEEESHTFWQFWGDITLCKLQRGMRNLLYFSVHLFDFFSPIFLAMLDTSSKLNSVFNSFLANVLILYSLKTPENLLFSDVFSGYKMGVLA